MKFAVVHASRDDFPVATQCKVFGVSRSGYYDFVGRMKRPTTERERAARRLDHAIRVEFDESRGSYGRPRILRALRKKGMRVGENRIRGRMAAMRLHGEATKAFRQDDGAYLLDFLLPTVGLGQRGLEELEDSGLLHAHATSIRKFGGQNGETKVYRLGHKITVSIEGLTAEPMYAVIPLTGSGRRLFSVIEAQASSGDDERATVLARWLLHNGRGNKAVVENDGQVTHEVVP